MKVLRLKLLFLIFLSQLFCTSVVFAKEELSVKLSQSSQQVWQRQQLIITLAVQTGDPFSRLEVDDFSKKGFSIIPFEQQRTESNQQATLTLKWVVFPFVSGKHLLELPRIRYRPNSGRIQTLKLQDLALQVRRLPVYVPPTMPVGEISLQSKWDEGWLVTTNNLLEWQVTLIGNQLAKQTMPPLTRQLVSSQSLDILPLQTENKVVKSELGVTHQRRYTIPLKAIKSGLLKLPTLEVQYFEPTTGKLQTAHLSPPLVFSINKWILRLILVLILIATLVLLFYGVKKLKQSLKKSAKRKQALQQLKQASSYSEIRGALNNFALSQGWESNLSLSQFIQQWEEKSNKTALAEIISTLQSQQFSQAGNKKIKNIAQNLWKILIFPPKRL